MIITKQKIFSMIDSDDGGNDDKMLMIMMIMMISIMMMILRKMKIDDGQSHNARNVIDTGFIEN